MKPYHWIYKLARWSLGAVFIIAGAMKLMAPGTFAVLIGAYGIVPEILLWPLAVMLPAVEIIAGVGLIFDVRGSLAAITGLLVIFVAVLGYGISMGLDVDCGCFGPGDAEAEAFHGLRPTLYRDLAMLAAAVFLYGWRWHKAIRPTRLTTLPKND